MEHLYCTNGLGDMLIDYCQADKPFSFIRFEPETDRVIHLLLRVVIEVIFVAVVAVKERKRLLISVYFQKISGIFLFDETHQPSFIFKYRTLFVYIAHFIFLLNQYS